MNILPFRLAVCCIAVLFCFSCRNDPKATTNNATTNTETIKEPGFELKTIQKKKGNCDTDNNCLELNARYPLLVGVDPVIQEKINESIFSQVIAAMEMEEEATDSISIDEAAQMWVDAFEEYLSDEMEDEVKWSFEMKGEGSMYKHFALVSLPVSTYTGGAHPNFYHNYNNYNLHNGAEIELEDIIVDSVAFRQLAEKAFYDAALGKEEELDKEDFFWGKAFYLPANFAITKAGLHLQYNPYEAAAYALGLIKFTLPYEELKTMIALPE